MSTRFSLHEAQRLYENMVARKNELLEEIDKIDNFVAALELVDGIEKPSGSARRAPRANAVMVEEENGKPRRRRRRQNGTLTFTKNGEMMGIVLAFLKESQDPVRSSELMEFMLKNKPPSLYRKHVSEKHYKKRVHNTMLRMRQRGMVVSQRLGEGFGLESLYCLPAYQDRLTKAKEEIIRRVR